jgi:hypothetical protein
MEKFHCQTATVIIGEQLAFLLTATATHMLVVATISNCWLALKLPCIALSHQAVAIFSFSFLAIIELDSTGAKFSIIAPSHSNSSRS